MEFLTSFIAILMAMLWALVMVSLGVLGIIWGAGVGIPASPWWFLLDVVSILMFCATVAAMEIRR